MPILASTNFVNGYGKASVVTTAGALPLESVIETSQDTFVVKYNTAGKAQWSARIGSAGTEIGYAVATDSSGNIYVTGQGGAALITVFNSDGTAFPTTILDISNGEAFIVKYNAAGTVQWVTRISSTSVDIGYAIATDSSGNMYVTGQSSNVVTAFNSNGTAFGTTLGNAGGSDVFIVKYDTSGFVQWVARVASAGNDAPFAMATDSSGNVYVTGWTGSGSVVTAFSSNGVGFSPTIPNSGGTDAYIVKYNTSGIVQWVARIASTQQDAGYGMATDSSGNVYVTGQGSTGSVVTAYNSDTTAFATTIPNSGNADAFIVKYNTSGFVQWVARVASGGNDIGYAIATDSSGNVYVTGQGGSGVVVTAFSSNGVAFGTTLANSGNTDAFLVKYDTSGIVQWVARVASAAVDIGYGIATDSSGNVYVTGQGGSNAVVTAFSSNGAAFGTTIANSGLNDAFIVKYNTNGIVQWVTRVAGTQTDIARAIAVDSGGNFCVTGQFTATPMTVYSSVMSLFSVLPNAGGSDAYIVKYGATGDPQWVARVASTIDEIGFAIATDSSGNVYVTGRAASGNVVTAFSSNGVAFGTTLPNSGGTDAFIVKYNTNGIVQWVARVASTSGDTAYGIATDSSGNVYVTGQCGATATAFSSDGVAFGTLTGSSGSGDAFIVKYDTSGIVQWVARVGSTSGDLARAIATDSSGNVYVTGQGGSGVVLTAFSSNGVAFGTTLANSGGDDAFIVKYNTSGIVQWVAKVASTAADIGYGITTDSSGNVYVTGQGGPNVALTAFSSNGVAFGTTLANSGSTDAFIVKYDTSGIVQWVARVASTASDIGYAIATDSSGNVYVTGQGGNGVVVTAFSSNGVAFGTQLTNSGDTDAFLVKYNTSGIVQWVARIASGAGDAGFGIATDSGGNVYVTIRNPTRIEVSIFNSDTSLFMTGNNSLGVVKYDTNGFAQWFQSISTPSGISPSNMTGIATDSSGNSYITGSSPSGSAVQIYGGGNSSIFRVLSSTSGQGVYIMKSDSNGNVSWLAQINGPAADVGLGITTDSGGNVYVTGRGGAVVTAFSSNGVAFGTTLTSSGGFDTFIVKYNTSGIVQWVARVGSTGDDTAYAIATDSSGNVYVTGQGGTGAVVTAFSSNGAAFGTTLANSGSNDTFLVKYDTSGIVQWVARVGSTSGDLALAIATDSGGNVYVTGQGGNGAVLTAFSSNGVAFGTTIANSGSNDAFIVKYNTSGIVQWVARVASTDSDIGFGIATDSGGNVYVTGQGGSGVVVTAFSSNGVAFGTTLANSGASDVFIVKYNTSGIVQWVARVASTTGDIGYAIATDSSGNVYVTGQGGSGGVVTAFSSSGVAFGTTLANLGGTDTFLVKYNTGGVVQWVARVASVDPDIGYGITTDSAGNVYVTGSGITSASAFNADGTRFGFAISRSSTSIANFVVKYNTSGVVQWIMTTSGVGTEQGRGIAIDGSSNIYSIGLFNGSYLVPYDA